MHHSSWIILLIAEFASLAVLRTTQGGDKASCVVYLYARFLRALMCLASLRCSLCLSWSLATCLQSGHTTSLSIQLFLRAVLSPSMN